MLARVGESLGEFDLQCHNIDSMALQIYYQATSTQMQGKKDSFPSPPTSCLTQQPTAKPHSQSNSYELHLISQYLAFNHQSSQDGPKMAMNKDLDSLRQKETQKQDQMANDKKQKSAFHNFQKHLINTLKNSIKLKKIQSIEKSRLRIAYELWQYFISSSKSTKKLLYNILGDNLINTLEFKKAPHFENIELHQLLQRTDKEEVQASQVYLKNVILKQSRNLLKGKLLKGRRMQRSLDFKSYFENFVQELETGNIMRRIPKDKKKVLLQNTSISESTC